MKTRQEMIYDFMLALASNSIMVPSNEYGQTDDAETAGFIYELAEHLTNVYLESL